ARQGQSEGGGGGGGGGGGEDGEEQSALADEETPSSGAGFDYFPAGCSQGGDGDDPDQRGVTAADMLGFRRDLCPELPPRPGTTSSTHPPARGHTNLTPPQRPAAGELAPAQPPQSRPPPPPRVPNPYE
ncbi:unnamed protein product, partial [Scytosiphon promiscuus]